MGNRTNSGTGRMTVDNRQKNERSRSGNPYSSHVKAGKHAGTVYNFKRKSRIRKSLTRLPILLEFIHKYIFLNFVSFYNGLNSNLHLHHIYRQNKKIIKLLRKICYNAGKDRLTVAQADEKRRENKWQKMQQNQ